MLGLVDSPFASMFGMMIHQRDGSRIRSDPISHSMSLCCAEYHVGYTMTLDLSGANVP